MQLPPPPRNFHFLNAKITPGYASGISTSFMYTPIPTRKNSFGKKLKCIKVKVNTPLTLSHLHCMSVLEVNF